MIYEIDNVTAMEYFDKYIDNGWKQNGGEYISRESAINDFERLKEKHKGKGLKFKIVNVNGNYLVIYK